MGDFHIGELWGGYDQIAWFRACVPIPREWRDEKMVLRFLVGPRDGYASTAETQLHVNGFPLQAIDVWHEEAWLPPEFAQLDDIVIALRAWNGIYLMPPQRRFNEASRILIDAPTEHFYYLTTTLLKAVQQLDEHDLRRSPTEPDETADQGRHEITYSLLPHAGTWRESGVITEAYALNDPLLTQVIPANPQGDLPAAYAWAEVDTDNIQPVNSGR